MMCKYPFIRTPEGLSREYLETSKTVRDNCTPFPCGKCLPCKINKSREWTNRLLLENMTSKDSLFLTLTYSDDYLPDQDALRPSHLTKFLKRLRRNNEPTKIRYFAVGEYGDRSWRPHYHLALYADNILHRHKLETTWGKGHIMSGDITPESARYLTGYVTKKITKQYTNGLQGRPEEFMRCSRHNGGLGRAAILQLAKTLKKNKYFSPRIIREIKHGHRTLPLGRYLTRQLATALSISDEQFAKETWDYQGELFDKYLTDDGHFLSNLINDTEGKRKSQEAKTKIYSSRRTI